MVFSNSTLLIYVRQMLILPVYLSIFHNIFKLKGSLKFPVEYERIFLLFYKELEQNK